MLDEKDLLAALIAAVIDATHPLTLAASAARWLAAHAALCLKARW